MPPSPGNNSRRHTRLACEIPVRITSASLQLDAFMVDASRSGLRLRVPGGPLGLYPMAPLSAVSQQVAKLLGVEFEACLHPVRLGPLLNKRVRPVRIGTIDSASADFELGCALSEPFTDEESAMLELGLHKVDVAAPQPAPAPIPSPRPPASVVGPMLKDQPTRLRVAPPPTAPAKPGEPIVVRASVPPPPAAAARAPGAPARPAAPAAPATPAPEPVRSGPAWRDWHAYVHPVGGQAGKPFLARIDDMREGGLQIRVPDRAMLSLTGDLDVASTTTALGGSYGSDVSLRLMDGSVHLWTGQARIEMLEVGEQPPHPVTLGLSFKRPLRPEELRALEVGPA